MKQTKTERTMYLAMRPYYDYGTSSDCYNDLNPFTLYETHEDSVRNFLKTAEYFGGACSDEVTIYYHSGQKDEARKVLLEVAKMLEDKNCNVCILNFGHNTKTKETYVSKLDSDGQILAQIVISNLHCNNVLRNINRYNIPQFRIDRGHSALANPFKMTDIDVSGIEPQFKDSCRRLRACEMYEEWFFSGKRPDTANLELKTMQKALSTHAAIELKCWCAPERCHGETIACWLLSNYAE